MQAKSRLLVSFIWSIRDIYGIYAWHSLIKDVIPIIKMGKVRL